ncbi:unnamed protein product, partial [Gulo gulo]
PREQDWSPTALLEPLEKIRSGSLPCLLKLAWSDLEIMASVCASSVSISTGRAQASLS